MSSEKREQLANVGTGAHTAGPWHVGFGETRDRKYFDVSAKLDPKHWTTICQCNIDGDNRESQEANARLIAAAPELLEALQYIVAWSADLAKWNPETARMKARAAIARATGAAS